MNADPRVMFFIFFVVVAGAVVGGTLMLRYKTRELEHRERMAALEKGMPLPAPVAVPSSGFTYYRRGLIWLFVGLAVTVLIGGLTLSQRQPSLGSRLMWANDAKLHGATEEQVQAIINDRTPRDGASPALALIGLIPIGVGLAYLLTYRAENQAIARER